MDSDTNQSELAPRSSASNANRLVESPEFDPQIGSAEENPTENSIHSSQTPDIQSHKAPNSAKRDTLKRSSHTHSRSSSFQNSIPFPLITVQQIPDRPTLNSIHSYDATTLQSARGLFEPPEKLNSKLKSPRQQFNNEKFEILDNTISNSKRPPSPVRSQSSSSAYTKQQLSTRNKSKSQINLPLMPHNTNSSASTSRPNSKRRETISGSNFPARSQNPTSASGTGPPSRSRASSGSSSTASMGYRYYTQEKAYLKKIQHDTHKDLNSKIVGNYFNYSDGDSESDDDYDLLPREAIGLGGVGTSFDDEYTDRVTSYPFLEASYNHEEMENDESLPERLEWQAMLSSVLTGEVVRSEKRRLKTSTDATMKEDDLWLEIRARICGRTLEDQKRSIADSRANVEATLQDIMQFHVTDASDLDLTLKEVNSVLLKLEYCEQLWQSTQIMKNTSALYRDPSFQRHVEALTTWSTITEWVFREIHLLKLWTGNDAIDPTLPPDRGNEVSMVESYSLVERVLKQDLMRLFDGKIKSNIGPVIKRAREGHLNFREEMNKIGLPVYVEGLEKLMKFPIKLIQEIISLRLVYSKKMANPTILLVDQTIEDLLLYMNIALMVKERNFEYTRPIPDINWITYTPDSLFDKTVLDCVVFFFELTSSKFIDISSAQVHRSFRELDNFESQYYFLEQVGKYVEGGEIVVAIHSCSLVMKMNSRLLSYWELQSQGPMTLNKVEIERWYTHTTERIRKAQRKLLRFYKILATRYENAVEYSIKTPQLKHFMNSLKETNHFLVYTGALEKDGIYTIADPSLINNSEKIKALLQGYSSRPETSKPVQYLLIICIQEPLVWEGQIANLDITYVDIDIKPGRMRIVSEGGSNDLREAQEHLQIRNGSADSFEVLVESISQLPKVNHELARIRKQLYRISMTVIADTCKFRKTFKGYQEVVHNFFAFAREFGQRGINVMDEFRRGHLAINLINLCIEWLSFICDDCVPTDIKTFRWTVVAIEFTMIMTRGLNIVALSDEQFTKLRLKVAGCMTLLISHFDIMGARSTAERRQRMTLDKELNKQRTVKDDVELLEEFHQEVAEKLKTLEQELRSNQNMGRVLDESDANSELLTYLAANFTKFSIRWQQGRFIGSGSFGTVYAAVNMDNGMVMAVKEIRMQDSQSMKQVLKALKDEMTVLEMLRHPNIVLYYGVEVHRDRVFIFMEYCQGGSLARLLEYGRIEDEKVIQVYTMQMLEGLSYLHHKGVVHRDVKPENILLDHLGVIKFADFGAAKFIARTGRTRQPNGLTSVNNTGNGKLNSLIGTPMYMSPEAITGTSQGQQSSTDIWAMGCCVLEMATGRRPWANLDNEWAIMYHIAAGQLPQLPSPDQLSVSGLAFLMRTLQRDPLQRPTAMDLLDDPWIINIRISTLGPLEGVSTPGANSTSSNNSSSLGMPSSLPQTPSPSAEYRGVWLG